MNFFQWLDSLFQKKTEFPVAEPKIIPFGTIENATARQIIQDKLVELKDNQANILLPDAIIKVYRKEDVKKFLDLDETDKIKYEPEKHDCDDFAAELFGKGMGLIWTMKHAMNFFIAEDNTLWFIEPQNGNLSQTLEDWQGWDVVFFLSR